MKRIDKLLAAMTIDEKIGQLNMVAAGYAITGPVLAGDVTKGVAAGTIGSILNLWGAQDIFAIQKIAVEKSRLEIPLLFGFDVLHGHKTIFPIPLAEAASFEPSLWERSAREAAIEAAEDGLNLIFAPMIDIARDPRWGRIAEGPGEDPLIASLFAAAKVRGFQAVGLPDGLARADAVAATAKHLCAYGAALAGRDYASADVSERVLREIYMPPFAASVEAGCAAIMPAFNDVNGIPMTAHIPLLRDWLRRELGFQGVVVSDYNAISELLRHGVVADIAEAAAAALAAEVDIDMMGGAYSRGLPPAIARGLVSIDQIDTAVRRVLELKERLGLFDAPYRRGFAKTVDPSVLKARLEFARDIARRCIVLLSNRDILPISPQVRRIALVGPLADASAQMCGPWTAAGAVSNSVSIREGLAGALPGIEIVYAPGVSIAEADTTSIAAACELCRGADLILLSLGEAAAMSGEAASRANPDLPGAQSALAQAIFEVGKPVVALISSGRPLMIPDIIERAGAVVATWFLGAQAGHAIADVLTGKFNPTGRLPVTWPRSVGQVPIYFAVRPSGRPANPDDPYTSKYLDMPVEPQFWFGHGLGYSRFTIANPRTSMKEFRRGDQFTVEADVANKSAVAGEQTVFMFSRDMIASVAPPLLELKGVAKIALGPGETGTVRFLLSGAELCLLGADLKPVLEPGEFQILVGPSADPRGLLSISVWALPG